MYCVNALHLTVDGYKSVCSFLSIPTVCCNKKDNKSRAKYRTLHFREVYIGRAEPIDQCISYLCSAMDTV